MNHSFNVEIAKEYGIEEAIILENIYFWCEKNKANDKLINGKPWTYNSVKAFNVQFFYMTPSKISRALHNLEENGLIETGCFNHNSYDRTKWYCITEKAVSFFRTSNSQNDGKQPEKIEDCIFQNEKSISQDGKSISQDEKSISQNVQMNITDINTVMNPNVTTVIKEGEGEQAPAHPKTRFLKPSLEEIRDYCLSRNNYVDPERFFDYYEANGWKVGKNPMKDWRAAVRTWESREKSEAPKKIKKEQHSDAEYEAMCDDLDKTPF